MPLPFRLLESLQGSRSGGRRGNLKRLIPTANYEIRAYLKSCKIDML